MEERNISITEKKISVIDRIINISGNALTILVPVMMVFGFIGKLFYIMVDLLVITIIFLYPLMELIKSRSQVDNRKLVLLRVKLATCIIYGTAIMFLLYKIMFSESIINERFYWLYNYIAAILVFIFVGITLEGFLKEVKALSMGKAGFTKYLGNFFRFLIIVFFILIIPLIQFYQPKEVIFFDNIKTPSELLVMDFRDKASNDWNSLQKRILNITDVKFMENLQKEISRNQGENVRNLDRFNYEMRNLNGESYYVILPSYKELNGRSPVFEGINEGYIYEIRIHKNGEVVLLNYHPYAFPFIKLPRIYRVKLSEEYKNMIIKAIEAGMEEKH